MVNHENYARVRAYLAFLRKQGVLADESVTRYKAYLRHLLIWAGSRRLREAYCVKPAYPAYLASLQRPPDGSRLCRSTVRKQIQVARRFFTWAFADDPWEFRQFPKSYLTTLVMPRLARASKERSYVSLEEAVALARVKVAEMDFALLRDRAASALLFLSGMRAGALATLPISCLALEGRRVSQCPEMGVHTKNGKSAETYLLDIPELLDAVREWDSLVRGLLPGETVWYAPVTCELGVQRLEKRDPGRNRSIALAKRLRKLFALAGLPYKSPHKFRHGHAVYGLQHARSMADYKAVSMNLMHSDIRVTDGIYAVLGRDEVQQRIAGLTAGGLEEAKLSDDLDVALTEATPTDLTRLLSILAARITGTPGSEGRGGRKTEQCGVGMLSAFGDTRSREGRSVSVPRPVQAATCRQREMEGTRTFEAKLKSTTHCLVGRMPARPGLERKGGSPRTRKAATELDDEAGWPPA